jgi:hypothetical protein
MIFRLFCTIFKGADGDPRVAKKEDDPNTIAYFQSLDPVVQPLLANILLTANHIVDRADYIDPLHLQFNVLPRRTEWVDTQAVMDIATESLLCYFRHCD